MLSGSALRLHTCCIPDAHSAYSPCCKAEQLQIFDDPVGTAAEATLYIMPLYQ